MFSLNFYFSILPPLSNFHSLALSLYEKEEAKKPKEERIKAAP